MTLGLYSLNMNITLGFSHYALIILELDLLNLNKALKLSLLRDCEPSVASGVL